MADNFFLRREMKEGITVLVGEDNDGPYAAVVQIRTGYGHIQVNLDKHGHFFVEVHPDSGPALPILGTIDFFTALVTRVDEEEFETPKKPRLN